MEGCRDADDVKQILRLRAVLILPDPVQGCDQRRRISALRTHRTSPKGMDLASVRGEVLYCSHSRLLRTVMGRPNRLSLSCGPLSQWNPRKRDKVTFRRDRQHGRPKGTREPGPRPDRREVIAGCDNRSDAVCKKTTDVIKCFNVVRIEDLGVQPLAKSRTLTEWVCSNLFVVDPTKATKRRIALVDRRWFAFSKPSCHRKESRNRRSTIAYEHNCSSRRGARF